MSIFLLGLLLYSSTGLEEDEAIALTVANGIVGDGLALVDSIERKGSGEDLGGGIPTKAMDEDVAVDQVGVSRCGDAREEGGLLEELDHLVPTEGLRELAYRFSVRDHLLLPLLSLLRGSPASTSSMNDEISFCQRTFNYSWKRNDKS